MKFLRFNFSHPVKVNAHLKPLSGVGVRRHHMNIASNEWNSVEIPIDECSDGNWRIELVWEYNNESFHHQKDFEVKGNKLRY